jgi:ferrous iron transport protein B
VPVVESVGVHLSGAKDLLAWLDSDQARQLKAPTLEGQFKPVTGSNSRAQLLALHQQVAEIMRLTVQEPRLPRSVTIASTPWCCTRCGARCCWW